MKILTLIILYVALTDMIYIIYSKSVIPQWLIVVSLLASIVVLHGIAKAYFHKNEIRHELEV